MINDHTMSMDIKKASDNESSTTSQLLNFKKYNRQIKQDSLPKKLQFLNIENYDYIILCPTCRKETIFKYIYNLKIFNHTKCVICYNNNVNILLYCKHAIMCDECLLKIMKLVSDDSN